MGIIKNIMNLFKEKEQELKYEKIVFKEIEKWTKDKEAEEKAKLDEILEFIKNEVWILVNSLTQNILVLKEINIEEKKVEQRVKFIVKQNLDYYIMNLEKLIKDLEKLVVEDANKSIIDINNLFVEFDKKSNMNLQKATFLIGKELDETRKFISEFFKNLKANTKKNEKFLEMQKVISIVKSNLKEIERLKEIIAEINKSIDEKSEEIVNLKKEIKENKDSIKDIKKSKDYTEELKKHQEIINRNKNLKNTFAELKNKIDFKALSGVFHSNKKEMNLIKEYEKDFQGAFLMNSENDLIELLDDAKINNQLIFLKIKEIKDLNSELKELEKDLDNKESKKIVEKESKIEKLNHKISELEYELSRKNRKLEKVYDEESEVKREIVDKLKRIEVEVKS